MMGVFGVGEELEHVDTAFSVGDLSFSFVGVALSLLCGEGSTKSAGYTTFNTCPLLSVRWIWQVCGQLLSVNILSDADLQILPQAGDRRRGGGDSGAWVCPAIISTPGAGQREMEDCHHSAGRGVHQWLPDGQGVGRPPVFGHRVLLLQGGQMQRPDSDCGWCLKWNRLQRYIHFKLIQVKFTTRLTSSSKKHSLVLQNIEVRNSRHDSDGGSSPEFILSCKASLICGAYSIINELRHGEKRSLTLIWTLSNFATQHKNTP